MKTIQHGWLSFGPEATGIMSRKTLARSLILSDGVLTTTHKGRSAREPRTGEDGIPRSLVSLGRLHTSCTIASEQGLVIIERVYDGEFDEVKTDAGHRQVPFDQRGVIAEVLKPCRARAKFLGSEDLVFANRAGKPHRPA